ncbi:hypothetical protein BGX34_003228, partial [Mortierella sp. NVP85]
MLWGPLALILDIEKELQYKHAEYNSSFSALRDNVDRKRGKRQAVEPLDGMILGTSTGLEISVLETAKKDDGPRSALCVTQTSCAPRFLMKYTTSSSSTVSESELRQCIFIPSNNIQ